MIEGISNIQAVTSTAVSEVSSPSFSNTQVNELVGPEKALFEKLISVDDKISHSEQMIIDYVKGEDVPVHEVMMALGKAKSELRLAVEVRNNLVEAYKSITSMQI